VALVSRRRERYQVRSPNGRGLRQGRGREELLWSALKGDQRRDRALLHFPAARRRSVLGDDARVLSDEVEKIDSQFDAINYVKAVVQDDYGQLTLSFKATSRGLPCLRRRRRTTALSRRGRGS